MKHLSTQCKLQNGNKISYSWIPKKFAVKGKYLKLKENGEWSDGWQVIEVWATRSAEEVQARRDDYLYQRKASDI